MIIHYDYHYYHYLHYLYFIIDDYGATWITHYSTGIFDNVWVNIIAKYHLYGLKCIV